MRSGREFFWLQRIFLLRRTIRLASSSFTRQWRHWVEPARPRPFSVKLYSTTTHAQLTSFRAAANPRLLSELLTSINLIKPFNMTGNPCCEMYSFLWDSSSSWDYWVFNTCSLFFFFFSLSDVYCLSFYCVFPKNASLELFCSLL